MREITISDMNLIYGAGVTETQCVAVFGIAGTAIGAIATRTVQGATAGGTAGNLLGGVVCNPIVNSINNNDSEDGDG